MIEVYSHKVKTIFYCFPAPTGSCGKEEEMEDPEATPPDEKKTPRGNSPDEDIVLTNNLNGGNV